jgi:hypothetical protein
MVAEVPGRYPQQWIAVRTRGLHLVRQWHGRCDGQVDREGARGWIKCLLSRARTRLPRIF